MWTLDEKDVFFSKRLRKISSFLSNLNYLLAKLKCIDLIVSSLKKRSSTFNQSWYRKLIWFNSINLHRWTYISFQRNKAKHFNWFFTFFYINRGKYWFRAKFRFLVFDGFTRFGMSWTRFWLFLENVCACVTKNLWQV